MTVDTSPIGIGWVINQEDSKGKRYAIRFGGKVLQGRQRNYAQIKKELWGIVSTIKDDRDYLIGAEVVIETNCLPEVSQKAIDQSLTLVAFYILFCLSNIKQIVAFPMYVLFLP